MTSREAKRTTLEIEAMLHPAEKSALVDALVGFETELKIAAQDKKISSEELNHLAVALADYAKTVAEVLARLSASSKLSLDELESYLVKLRDDLKKMLEPISSLSVEGAVGKKGQAVTKLHGLNLYQYFMARVQLDVEIIRAEESWAKANKTTVDSLNSENAKEVDVSAAAAHYQRIGAIPATKVIPDFRTYHRDLRAAYPSIEGGKTQTLDDVIARLDSLSPEVQDRLVQYLGAIGLVVAGGAIAQVKQKLEYLNLFGKRKQKNAISVDERAKMEQAAEEIPVIMQGLRSDGISVDQGVIDGLVEGLKNTAEVAQYEGLTTDNLKEFRAWYSGLMYNRYVHYGDDRWKLAVLFDKYMDEKGVVVATRLPDKGTEALHNLHNAVDEADAVVRVSLNEEAGVDYDNLSEEQERGLNRAQEDFVNTWVQPRLVALKAALHDKPPAHPTEGTTPPPPPPPEKPVAGRGDGGNGDGGDKGKKETGSAKENALVVEMYKLFRHNNPYLPEYDRISPENSAIVMRELVLAIFNIFKSIFDKSSSGGKKVIPLPSNHESLWGFRLGVEGNIPDENRTIEYFFQNFPWQKLSKTELTFDERENWVELWKGRILHIAFAHNWGADYQALYNSEQSGDYITKILEAYGAKVEDQGFAPFDLSTFYKTDFTGTEFEKLVGKEDTSWKAFCGLVDYFVFCVEMYNSNLSPRIKATTTALSKNKDMFIKNIPESVRLKGPNGKYRDTLLVEHAWSVAIWTLYATNRMFKFDSSGLSTKAGRAANVRLYATKVYSGKDNTTELYADTAHQLERSLTARADFMHYLVRLTPDMYDQLKVEDIGKEIEKLESKKDVHSKARAKKLKLFRRELRRMVGAAKDVKDRDAKVNERYLILKVKPEYSVFGLNIGLPVAVDKNYIEFAAREGYEDYLVMSETQVNETLMDRNHVDFSTMTEGNQSRWVDAMKDADGWYRFVDIKVPDAIFPDIHSVSSKIQQKISVEDASLALSRMLGPLNAFLYTPERAVALDEYLRGQISIPEIEPDEYSKKTGMNFGAITQYFGRYYWDKMIVCGPELPNKTPIPVVEPILSAFHIRWGGNSKDGTTHIERRRITFVSLKNKIMSLFKGKKAHHDAHDGTIDPAKSSFANFRALRNTKDGDLIKELAVTQIAQSMRNAADKLLQPGTDPRKAQNQFIADSFMVALGLYLDRYAYRSVESGKPVAPSTNVKLKVQEVHTLSQIDHQKGFAPMDFAHRQLLLAYCEAMFHSFAHGQDFGNGNPALRADVIPTLADVIKMMKDRGIIGTYEQMVVDLDYLNNKYPSLQNPSETKNGKKGGGH